MNQTTFFDHVARRTGLESGPELTRVVRGTLRSLGEGLSPDAAEALRAELPTEIGEALADVEHGQEAELNAVIARVSGRNGVTWGVALEQLGVVASTLTEALRPEVLEPIRRAVPWRLGRLFVTPPPVPSAPAAHHDPRHRSLAEARAASSRPLFAAQPRSGQSESVVCADNPHAETKLSSAQGLTQEREGESLATAHPSKP